MREPKPDVGSNHRSMASHVGHLALYMKSDGMILITSLNSSATLIRISIVFYLIFDIISVMH